MKVNDPNLSSLASNAAARTRETEKLSQRPANPAGTQPSTGDDVHLSELVRSLRSLAADSPERQARIEELARSVANGTYKVDAEATASGIIDDAFTSK